MLAPHPVRCRKGEVGRDLREELERLGAEAQHLPLASPPVGVRGEEEPEDQYTSLKSIFLSYMITK